MKPTITLLIALVSSIMFSQQPPSEAIGGKPILERNEGPCLSQKNRTAFFDQIEENIVILREQGRLIETKEQGNHPLFIWPVEQEDGFNYNSIWALTNYVDHDPSFPNSIQDFECGTRSYDTTSGYNHTGYDIATWPF